MAKFYVTTPIYYVNARPHIGHAYTTIVADVVARRRRLLGDDVRFLTGTDEHGQKIERAAAAAGTTPQAFADSVSAQFSGLWKRMGLTHDHFIRTTDASHQRGTQHLFTTLKNNGFINLQTYTGQYCVSDEAFQDVPVGAPCPDCGRPTETVSEENYYFALSRFQPQLIDVISSGTLDVQPETRRNEVLSFLRGNLNAPGATPATTPGGVTYIPGALKDLSISRSSFKWGIPVPGDPKHVIYVWLDALANYISYLGYGSDNTVDFDRFWPADLHLVGKEIIRFHCVYWPAFLMAANLPLPKKIVAHGWLLFEESKMSKSRGNIVRAETILDAFGSLLPNAPKTEQDLFGADVLRYFLLREIPFGADGSFSFDALLQRYNSDLANGYGNLVSRTLTMIEKYFEGITPSADTQAAFFDMHKPLIEEQYGKLEFTSVCGNICGLIAATDQMITASAPWKLAAKDDEASKQKLKEVLCEAAESIRIITALLHPILPYCTGKVWEQLGLGNIETAAKEGKLKNLKWGNEQKNTRIGAISPIFPRADKELITRMNDLEKATTAPAESTQNPSATTPNATQTPSTTPSIAAPTAPAQITIDDFIKIELRVAEIKIAERIPKSDKLLRLEVDLGPLGIRQVLAGIAEYYDPATLPGRRCIIVANLAPRKMRGLESHGMLLAASLGDGDKPAIATFLDDIALGARVR